MTIDEAIKILKEHIDLCDPIKEADTYKALQLGIEALKAVAKLRHYPFPDEILKLPSETE